MNDEPLCILTASNIEGYATIKPRNAARALMGTAALWDDLGAEPCGDIAETTRDALADAMGGSERNLKALAHDIEWHNDGSENQIEPDGIQSRFYRGGKR